MKIKTTVIYRCKGQSCCEVIGEHSRIFGKEYLCKRKDNRIIKDPDAIPSWCPLPNAEED